MPTGSNNYIGGVDSVLAGRISIKEGVCGGSACIRSTRIPVWLIMAFLGDGVTVDNLLEQHPTLEPLDIEAARHYARLFPVEISNEILQNDV